MKKVTKPVSITLQILICGLAVVCVAVWSLGKAGIINPLYPFVVLSGSMSPAVKTGSVVLVTKKPFGYAVGDIVTYTRGGKDYTTHRVKSLIDQSGSIGYITQGDANNTPDPAPVSKAEVKGAVLFSIPYIGYLVNRVKTPYGFILLVIIPATIIIYEELRSMKHETVKMVKSKKQKKKSPPPSVNFVRSYRPLSAIALPHPITNLAPTIAKAPPKISKKPKYNAPVPPARSPLTQRFFMQAGVSRLSVLIPFAATIAIFMGVSGAYFSDSEKSTGNVMGAGTWGPTATPSPTVPPIPSPTPTPIIANYLVINEVLPNSSCSLGGNKMAQWVELYNGSSSVINIKNYKLNDGTADIDIVNANTDINPGEIVLLAKDNSVWTQCFTKYNNANRINLGSNVNLNSGTLILKSASLVVIDTVKWGSTPNPAPPINQSIERKPKGLDTAVVGADFNPSDFIVNSNPSPGAGL